MRQQRKCEELEGSPVMGKKGETILGIIPFFSPHMVYLFLVRDDHDRAHVHRLQFIHRDETPTANRLLLHSAAFHILFNYIWVVYCENALARTEFGCDFQIVANFKNPA